MLNILLVSSAAAEWGLPPNPPWARGFSLCSRGAPRRAQPSPRATGPIHRSPHAAARCQPLGEALAATALLPCGKLLPSFPREDSGSSQT